MKRIAPVILFLFSGIACFSTTIDEVVEVCAVCGQMSTQTVVRSTNQMGSPDLDLRPPEMARSTIEYWVQECPHCGYCYRDISELAKNARETVADPGYKGILAAPLFPRLANRFFCMARIYETADDPRGKISSTIFAAWVCDDEKSKAMVVQAAAGIRLSAAGAILEYQKTGELYMADKGGDEILLSDLYRRAGEFEKALKAADIGLAAGPEEMINNILLFEKALAEKKDAGAYTVDQVPGSK